MKNQIHHYGMMQRSILEDGVAHKVYISKAPCLHPVSTKTSYILSETMIENIVQDFIPVIVKPKLKEMKDAIGDSENTFFALIYSAALQPCVAYKQRVHKLLQPSGKSANMATIVEILCYFNNLLNGTELAYLKSGEPYNQIEKIQPVKDEREAQEAIKQIQAIMRPQYLQIIAEWDVNGKYYDKLVKYGWIADYKEQHYEQAL